jgi:hypothetical protein
MLAMAILALVVGAFNGNSDDPVPLRIFLSYLPQHT